MKGGLKAWWAKADRTEIRHTALIISIPWAILVAYFVLDTIYTDHKTFAAKNAALREQIDGADGFKATIRQRDATIATLNQQLSEAQTKLFVDDRVFNARPEVPPATAPDTKQVPAVPRPKPTAPAPTGKYVCTTLVTPRAPDTYAVIVEFGSAQTTNGFAGAVYISQKITTHLHWEAAPLRTDIAQDNGGMYTNVHDGLDGDQVYRLSFGSPDISSHHSEYFYIGSDKPFDIKGILFLEDIDTLSDPLKSNTMAASYSTCPR